MLYNMYRSTGRKHYILQISNSFFMIPASQKGCIVCLRTEKRLPSPYFFSHVITFFEKQKPFVHVLVLGFFCKFSFCFLDEILINPRLKVVLSTNHTQSDIRKEQTLHPYLC